MNLNVYLLRRRGRTEPGKLQAAIVQAESEPHARVRLSEFTNDIPTWTNVTHSTCVDLNSGYISSIVGIYQQADKP